MKTKLLLVLVAGIVTGACGCGGGSASSRLTIRQVLAITTISPTSAPAGGAAFVLAVQGTKFVPGSVINFGNMPIAAAYSCIEWDSIPQPYCGATQLSATIPAAAITPPGAVPVTVTNPAGGGTSNAVNFAITSGPYPEANITSFGPTGALAGSPGFTLDLIVVNFLTGSVVRWNGSDRPTTARPQCAGPSGCWDVEAQIPASDIAAPGTAAITIFNPAPGAGSSNAVTFAIATHGLNPSSVAVNPAGTFAYVTNFGTGNVSTYAINTDGTLTFKATIAAGTGPVSIAVDRSGKFAYVANLGSGDVSSDVSTYVINTDGTLTFKGTIAAGIGPASVVVDPSGRFAYVANQGDVSADVSIPGSVSMYTIDTTTGALTPNGTIAPGTVAVSVAVDPSGKFAYVANEGYSNGSVLMYTIDTTTGALTPNGEIGGLGIYGGGNKVVVDPSGRFAYVGQDESVNNTFSGGVSMYSIDGTTGKLTSMGSVDAVGDVLSLAVHPSGNFAYATADSFVCGQIFSCAPERISPHVSVYTLNAATGVLAPNGTAPTEQNPISIAIAPSGKFAYVANFNSHSISMYTIDAVTGTLTLIGTIIT